MSLTDIAHTYKLYALYDNNVYLGTAKLLVRKQLGDGDVRHARVLKEQPHMLDLVRGDVAPTRSGHERTRRCGRTEQSRQQRDRRREERDHGQ